MNLKLKQLYLSRVEDDAVNDEELSLRPGPAREVHLLVAVVVLVLVGIPLWLIIGPMINPCQGITEGAVIRDTDHPDRVLVCKG